MKMLEIVIRPFKLDDTMEMLRSIGVHGVTVTEVRGFGRQKGHKELYRGAEYEVDLVPKVKLQLLVKEEMVEKVTLAAAEAARTGKIGDGKIFVLPALEAVRIRTGERGDAALS
jgi:nitrogen regulatory protein P-II 1